MTTVRFHPEAEVELTAEALYYEERSAGLGERFTREVEAALALAAVHPRAGSPYRYGTRRVFPRLSILHRVPSCPRRDRRPRDRTIPALSGLLAEPKAARGPMNRSDGQSASILRRTRFNIRHSTSTTTGTEAAITHSGLSAGQIACSGLTRYPNSPTA